MNRSAEQIQRWLDGEDDAPGKALASVELAGVVRATLTQLSPDHETLLSAKYLDGASVEEIASYQNCSAEAVRSKLARARKAFRRALARTAPDLIDPRLEGRHES